MWDGKDAPVENQSDAENPGLDDLEVDLASGVAIDLKSISKQAARMAEKRVIERVLTQTRWNRKEAAEMLQISLQGSFVQNEGEWTQ